MHVESSRVAEIRNLCGTIVAYPLSGTYHTFGSIPYTSPFVNVEPKHIWTCPHCNTVNEGYNRPCFHCGSPETNEPTKSVPIFEDNKEDYLPHFETEKVIIEKQEKRKGWKILGKKRK